MIALTAIAVGWPWWALTKLLRTMNAVQRDEIARIADSVWVRTGAGGVRGTGRSCVRTIDEAVRRGVALTATCCSPCLSCPSRTSPSSYPFAGRDSHPLERIEDVTADGADLFLGLRQGFGHHRLVQTLSAQIRGKH